MTLALNGPMQDLQQLLRVFPGKFRLPEDRFHGRRSRQSRADIVGEEIQQIVRLDRVGLE
jgi:hypothetical protein